MERHGIALGDISRHALSALALSVLTACGVTPQPQPYPPISLAHSSQWEMRSEHARANFRIYLARPTAPARRADIPSSI